MHHQFSDHFFRDLDTKSANVWAKTGCKLIKEINKQIGDQKLTQFYDLFVLFVKFTGQYGCHKCDIVSTGRSLTANKHTKQAFGKRCDRF